MADLLPLMLLTLVMALFIGALGSRFLRRAPRRPFTVSELNLFGPSVIVLGAAALTLATAVGGGLLYFSLGGGLRAAAYDAPDESSTRQLLLRDMTELAPPGARPSQVSTAGCDSDRSLEIVLAHGKRLIHVTLASSAPCWSGLVD